MIKNLSIIVLLVLVFALFYFILEGSFCHCSTIYIHKDNPYRKVLTYVKEFECS